MSDLATPGRVHRAAGFLRPRPVDQPAVRLVVFHHAGGSAAAYFSFARAVPPTWDVVLADFPGRGTRHRDPVLTDIAGLVEVAVADTLRWAGPPVALFGHSLGAVVAIEVARAIQERVDLAWVGVSGRSAPASVVPSELDSPFASDERLMAALARLGGLPDRIDEVPGFRDQFLRVVRDDLAAFRSYRPGLGRPPITAPITAFGGTADLVAPPASIAEWADETTGPFRQLLFDGGHFYFTGRAFPGFARAVQQEIELSLLRDYRNSTG